MKKTNDDPIKADKMDLTLKFAKKPTRPEVTQSDNSDDGSYIYKKRSRKKSKTTRQTENAQPDELSLTEFPTLTQEPQTVLTPVVTRPWSAPKKSTRGAKRQGRGSQSRPCSSNSNINTVMGGISHLHISNSEPKLIDSNTWENLPSIYDGKEVKPSTPIQLERKKINVTTLDSKQRSRTENTTSENSQFEGETSQKTDETIPFENGIPEPTTEKPSPPYVPRSQWSNRLNIRGSTSTNRYQHSGQRYRSRGNYNRRNNYYNPCYPSNYNTYADPNYMAYPFVPYVCFVPYYDHNTFYGYCPYDSSYESNAHSYQVPMPNIDVHNEDVLNPIPEPSEVTIPRRYDTNETSNERLDLYRPSSDLESQSTATIFEPKDPKVDVFRYFDPKQAEHKDVPPQEHLGRIKHKH